MVVTLKGSKYKLVNLEREDLVPGTLIRYGNGSVVRRVLGADGDENVLRGVASRDVLEAIDTETVMREWYRLESVPGR